jgi:4-phytase / acid phosphatase
MLCASGSRLCAQQSTDTPSRLKFAIILSRHGVRSPTGSLDQLNHYSAQPWPKWEVPPGNLTSHGAKLMTLFGAYYRSYFAGLGLMSASGCEDAAHVYFYADSDQRTVETGKSLAAGFFPHCAPAEQPVQDALPQGKADPLFHPLAASIGVADHKRAAASIAGRIGDDPAGVTEAYRPQLEILQQILLGSSSASPGTQASPSVTKLLLDTPPMLDAGKGDHLAELKGPLSIASTLAESLLLEYTEGMPMDRVGWGRVDLATLRQLMELHTAAADLTRRTSYIATVQASNLLAHILDTLQQEATGKQTAGALDRPGDRVLVLVGHDTNLANIAAMLNINWLIDGRRDDTPPGGALVFELWQSADAANYEIRSYYIAQTLEQMRNMTPLDLQDPPDRASIFIPGCSQAKADFPCEWKAFQQALNVTINRDFVK